MSKHFLIIGNGNAVTYKEFFPYIKNNQIWIGAGKGMGGKAMEFFVDESIYDATKGSVNRIENGKCYVGVMMCTWFTNIEHKKRNTPIDLYNKYNPTDFPKYDDYDAIEVSKVTDIPEDYKGVMGVPISFLDKYCPSQFQILGVLSPKLKGKKKYKRLLIKRKIKKFLIIGNLNAITYKEIFPYIKNNQLWLGVSSFNSGMYFQVPENYQYADTYKFDRERNGRKVMRVSSICWYTNIPHTKRNTKIDLFRKYNEKDFPKYDNYDAIEVSKVTDIPEDYNGVMGVPISFLDKYCLEQFEIVWFTNSPFLNGKPIYKRLFIKRVKNNETKEI